MTRAELLALAARVEAAPDNRNLLFNIGCDVLAAIGRSVSLPNPCLSLDAAALLVPDGLFWILATCDPETEADTPSAWVGRKDQDPHKGGAATPALALTAAALRAMAEAAGDE